MFFFRPRRKHLSGPLSFVSRLHRRGEQEPEGHRRQEGHQCRDGGWEEVLPLPPFIQTPRWAHGHSLPPKSPQSGVYKHKGVGHECLHYVCFVFVSNSRSNSALTCPSDGSIFQKWEVGLPNLVCSCRNYAMPLLFLAFYHSDCLNNMFMATSSIWVTRKSKGNNTATTQWMTA